MTKKAKRKKILYYYTDPLAAAWMAKYFKIKFIVDEKKYYIHPESLHILKPQENDIFLFLWYDNPMIVKSDEAYKDIKEHGFEDKYISMTQATNEILNPIPPKEIYGYDTNKHPSILDRSSIAQRRGIPFHWPEKEVLKVKKKVKKNKVAN